MTEKGVIPVEKYGEVNLERAMKLPDDTPNKKGIIQRWQYELRQERKCHELTLNKLKRVK